MHWPIRHPPGGLHFTDLAPPAPEWMEPGPSALTTMNADFVSVLLPTG